MQLEDIDKKLLIQLKDFTAWKNSSSSNDFSILSYLYCIATPDLLFAFSELFSPTLINHQGYYFIKSKFSESAFEKWREKLDNLKEVQKVMNHLHIYHIFQSDDISDEIAIMSANIIAEFWTKQFNDKGLIGVVYGDSIENIEVTLYQSNL